jgi:ABC-2 type transport system permease protein
MVALFNGMQSSLAMVYDREMGVMRPLLTTPLPRGWILACKLAGGALPSYVLAAIPVFLLAGSGALWGYDPQRGTPGRGGLL